MLASPVEREALCGLVQAAYAHPSDTYRKLLEARFEPGDFTDPKAQQVAKDLFETLTLGKRYLPGLAKLAPDALKLAEWASAPGGAVALNGALAALKNDSRRVLLSALLLQLAQGLKTGATTSDEALQAIESSGLHAQSSGNTRTMAEIVESVHQQAKAGKSRLVRTGFREWDARLGGVRSTLTVIGAQPGVGKSALLGGLAIQFAARNQNVGVLSLEDEGEWLGRRVAAAASGLSLGDIYEARPEVVEILGQTAAALKSDVPRLFVRDLAKPTPSELVASARQMIAAHRLSVLMIDHLGELDVGRRERHDLEVDSALSSIRAIANKASIPVILFAHTKRKDGDGPPQLTDFAFSAGVERKARLALALTRLVDPLRPTAMTLHVLKNTEGSSGFSFELPFLSRTALVME